MRKYLKRLFSFNSKSYKYTYEIIQFTLFTMGFFMIFLFCFLMKLDEFVFLRVVFAFMVIIYYYTIIAFISRLTFVADNIELLKLLKGKIKFKYNPIAFSYEDIIFFIGNTKIPETIYAKSNIKGYHMIDIVYDVKGRRGPYYNKQFYFDGELIISFEELSKRIYDNLIIDDKVLVCATFDKQPPEVLVKLIEELKS